MICAFMLHVMPRSSGCAHLPRLRREGGTPPPPPISQRTKGSSLASMANILEPFCKHIWTGWGKMTKRLRGWCSWNMLKDKTESEPFPGSIKPTRSAWHLSDSVMMSILKFQFCEFRLHESLKGFLSIDFSCQFRPPPSWESEQLPVVGVSCMVFESCNRDRDFRASRLAAQPALFSALSCCIARQPVSLGPRKHSWPRANVKQPAQNLTFKVASNIQQSGHFMCFVASGLQVLWLLMAPPQNLSHHERDSTWTRSCFDHYQ